MRFARISFRILKPVDILVARYHEAVLSFILRKMSLCFDPEINCHLDPFGRLGVNSGSDL
jgi:hypothetical protein